MPSATSGAIDLSKINSDILPATPDVFDIGSTLSPFKSVHIALDLTLGRNLTVGGDLTVDGTTTTINSTILTVDDKNITLASTPSPTDALADGGGIILKGTTDKTILWKDATNSWDFNQPIRTGNIQLNGNTISCLTSDLDVTTQTGGVFKFTTNAFQSGQDASNYLEIGHGGSNAFINAVGAGEMDFRFGGVNKASFTPAGHLHLKTDTDQKHNLKIITASNLNDSGIAWENSGGNFSQTIFRTDVGSNRSDLVFAIGSDANIDLLTDSFKIHGSAANEGRLEVLGAFQISSGSPGIGKVWTDAGAGDGIGTWEVSAGGGWTDDGTVVRLGTSTDDVVIGANTGFGAKLDVRDAGGTVIGGFPSGALHVTSPSADINANAIITGHNLFGGNKQLWYLGSVSGSNDNIALINRQTGSLSLQTSGNGDILLTPNGTGKVGVDEPGPDTKLHVTDGGSAGVVTAFPGTIATFESPGNGFLSILTPDANIRGILFGEPSSNIAGGIFYNDPGSPDGFQFRVNGNVTQMVIEPDSVGIGTTNPDVTALLDLNSTTLGFLPPRMTTAERDAIVSPAPGLRIHNTTVDKGEIFTGATWKTVLTEDIGQVLVQETFASSNVRFFGELGLPAAQGWTDTPTGIATIDLVTQTVFGEVKQVVRHNDDSSGATTSDIALTAQKWIDINAFGASYGGTERLDTVDGGSGFFSGLQANSAENPLATGNRRYGVLFDNSGGNLRLRESDNTGNAVIMDGTSGNPLITFDEWFSWECVIPAGLGAAEFYINGILTSFIPTFLVNSGGLGTAIKVGSGSSSGVNRIVYHDNFGVTIYEEAATKTLAAATMVGDVVQINIPEGKRDYTIILPDGNPRAIGAVLRLVASNVLGSISLENQNPAAPEVLYNGLRTLVINVAVKETIEGINTVSSGNVYLGFEIATLHVGGKFIDTTDQIIVTASIPQVITFNINKILDGMSHTIGSSVFTINTSGKYKLEVTPQVFQGSGAAKVEFWLRRSGTDIVDSGVQLDIGANNQALPVLLWKEELLVSDTVECVWASDSANTKLDNLTSLFGGPNIPSIMFRATLVAI